MKKKELKVNETYSHKLAKEILFNHFLELEKQSEYCNFKELAWKRNYGVFTELPFHKTDDQYYFENSKGLKDNFYDIENPLDKFIDGFDRGKILFIPDITIFHKGAASLFIEVVLTNSVSEKKLKTMKKFFKSSYFELYEVSSYDILNSIHPTFNKVKFSKII